MIQNHNFTQVFFTFSIAGHGRPGWAEIRSGPGLARARYFIFHHIPITPIGGPGPEVFYLSSPYTHHSYRRGILPFITIYPSFLSPGHFIFYHHIPITPIGRYFIFHQHIPGLPRFRSWRDYIFPACQDDIFRVAKSILLCARC